MWDVLRPKCPKKIQKPKYLAKKQEQEQKTVVKGPAGAHYTRVQNFRVLCLISDKRRGHWTVKGCGVVCLNQPLYRTFRYDIQRYYVNCTGVNNARLHQPQRETLSKKSDDFFSGREV